MTYILLSSSRSDNVSVYHCATLWKESAIAIVLIEASKWHSILENVCVFLLIYATILNMIRNIHIYKESNIPEIDNYINLVVATFPQTNVLSSTSTEITHVNC